MAIKHDLTRRALLSTAGALTLFTALPAFAEEAPLLEVVKTPSCGCCAVWIDMARTAGFTVEVTDNADYAGMKRDAGVPRNLASCHTARIDGYVVEGHVPFAAIRALLRDRPDIAGIAVPGMPARSPGMGGALDAVVPVTAWGGSAGKGAAFDF